jgi:hypothetical protein
LDTAQQERIRQALLAYKEAHAIGVWKLSRRISEAHPRRPEIIVKTLQRFLAGRAVNEQMVAFCDHFTSKLPHRPTLWHTVGDALFAIFKQTLPEDLNLDNDITAALTPAGPFSLVTFKTKNGPADGVLAALSPDTFVTIARERLMLAPHVILYTLDKHALTPQENAAWRRFARTIQPKTRPKPSPDAPSQKM